MFGVWNKIYNTLWGVSKCIEKKRKLYIENEKIKLPSS